MRLPGLSLHLYNRRIIQYIGDVLGKVIHIDYNTGDMERGKFARLVVSINLKELLVSKFMLNGEL